MSSKVPVFAKIVKGVCVGFLKVFYPYQTVNGKNLPDDEAVIVCSNHISNLDPVFINVTQNRLLHFMAKKELFKNKLFGALITKLGAFPVNRGNDGGKAIGKAEELLSSGECIGIFLEGTRSKTGKLGRGHIGALVIARAANAPIVPCCITGKKTFIKPFRKTMISYGEPMTCEELGIVTGDSKELRAAANTIMAKIAELREQQTAQLNPKG